MFLVGLKAMGEIRTHFAAEVFLLWLIEIASNFISERDITSILISETTRALSIKFLFHHPSHSYLGYESNYVISLMTVNPSMHEFFSVSASSNILNCWVSRKLDCLQWFGTDWFVWGIASAHERDTLLRPGNNHCRQQGGSKRANCYNIRPGSKIIYAEEELRRNVCALIQLSWIDHNYILIPCVRRRQVGAELPVDSDDADFENKHENGSTLLCVFERGWGLCLLLNCDVCGSFLATSGNPFPLFAQ